MGPKMPDNAIYKLVRRLLLSSQLTTVNCEAVRRQTGIAVVRIQTPGVTGVYCLLFFYDRASMIMRTGRMAAAATEHERPL